MNMTSEALTSYIGLPITADLFIRHITTSPEDLWNNLPDCARRAPSLNVFKSMLKNVNLATAVKCNCNFCTKFRFYIASFPLSIVGFRIFFFLLIYLILFNRYWIYSYLARSRLNESCTHRCNADK